jgi:DNA repair exonuclease SbcCD ATPase subunit
MDKKLEDILNEALAPELKEQLQEAFNIKVEGMRAEVEESVRAELANRYEHDKGQLVEAMDRMLSDVIRVHEETKAGEIAKLKEARQKVEESANSTKSLLRKQIASMANTSGKLINESLSKEISALRNQRLAITAKAEALAEDVAGVKGRLSENHAKHLEKINDFVTKQLTKEIMEFAQDKRALVETRVKLISEHREKLAATQKAFIKEAAKKVEDTVNGTLSREMKQLHEDLERQRQNAFGRRIFEAVAAEFQTSYLAEGTEMRKLQKVLESKEAEIAAVQAEVEAAEQKLTEAAKAKEAAERKIALAEGRAERTKIMSELMSNLKGDKRAVMESMLETTKTSQLRASFHKLLPVVLNEGSARKVAPTGKKVLTENPAQTTVTGNRDGRVIMESQEETQETTEMAAIMRLAGVRK